MTKKQPYLLVYGYSILILFLPCGQLYSLVTLYEAPLIWKLLWAVLEAGVGSLEKRVYATFFMLIVSSRNSHFHPVVLLRFSYASSLEQHFYH